MDNSTLQMRHVEWPEPHRERTKRLLAAHPEAKELCGPTPSSAAFIALLVGAQVFLAWLLRDSPWWAILIVAYLLGALICHALWVLIHECAHNLVFRAPSANAWVGMLANLPIVFPSSIAFRKYHLLHHAYQGQEELDADLASPLEARLVGNAAWRKALWMLCYFAVQALRVPRLKRIRLLDGWYATNLAVQLAFIAGVVALAGWWALGYLLLSSIFSIGLHPVGGRWIQEHYLTFPGDQETFSYYGPLNVVAFNVGYHNEHHDLMRVPWSRLPALRRLAPELYDPLHHHRSWTRLVVRFIFDPSISLYSRITRGTPAQTAARVEPAIFGLTDPRTLEGETMTSWAWEAFAWLGSILVVAAALGPSGAGAAAPPGPPPQEGTFVAKNFKFQSGEVLPEVRLHYITLGTPHRDASGKVGNAVLLLHGTTGTGKNWLSPSLAGELFGPGQPLDASRYYLIMPDGIGRGGSSKPSDGLRAKFPRYGYLDVVAAQHLLVTEGLKVDHLHLVLGTSMGGMQTYLWGERYPDFMDALMPVTSQPTQISGRNLLWRRALTESIRNDPDWNGGEYKAQPRHWVYAVPFFSIMVDSPVRLQAEGPTRQAATALYDKVVENARKTYDANDFLYWFESSWDYDPEPDLAKIKAKLFAVNFAGDLINPSDLGVYERLIPKVPRGRFVVVPESEKTAAHQTQTRAAVWKPYLEQLLAAP